MLRECPRLVLSRYLRPMSSSELWKFSVVVQRRAVHRLHGIRSSIEPKPRIKPLHIPGKKKKMTTFGVFTKLKQTIFSADQHLKNFFFLIGNYTLNGL